MKLSTSSSIFFATLALSSSSSALAAPARDSTESSLSASPSSHDLFESSVHPATHCSAHRDQPQPTPIERNSGSVSARSTTTIRDLLEPLSSLPILKPLVDALDKLLPTVGGQNLAETVGVSAQSISADDIAALQSAIQGITRALNDTIVPKVPTPSQVKNVASGLPIPFAQSNFDPPVAASGSASASFSMSSTQASSTPSMAVNDVPSSSSSAPSTSATPPSPVIPLNPPNSPSLPALFPF